jgi:hypothetical protein
MARLWHGGAELNSATDAMEVDTNSGTVSISSTTVRSGSYAWRVNPTSGTGFYRKQISGADQNKGGYLRVYINIATNPGATIQLIRFSSSGNAHLASIRLASDGTLRLHNAANAQVGSASSALSTGQWYMVELKCDSTNATGTLDARLDGVSFASGNNSSRGSWARILWGAITPNSTCDIFFDDIALNDDQGSNQTSWPGSGKLIRLKPNAAGDSNQWLKTAGGAGDTNNYQLVDEVTPNNATDYIQSTTLNDNDDYNLEASGIGSSDTVNVVTVHARLTNDVADATIAAKLGISKTSGGTVTEGSSIIPNSTTWMTDGATATFLPTLVTYADPDASAWTQSTLDTAHVRAKITADSANKILLSALWAYVDYTPSSGTNVTVNPTVQSIVASFIAATVLLGATLSPAAQAVTASIQAPTVKHDFVVTPNVQTGTVSLPPPTVIPETKISPDTQTATFSVQTPTLAFDFVVAPSTQTGTFSIPSPTVVAVQNATVSPNAQSATFSLQSPDLSLGVGVSPAVQAVTASVQTPQVYFDFAVTPNALSAAFSAPAPTVQVSIALSPNVQTATFSTPALSVTLGATISPAAQSAAFSLPVLSVLSDVTIAPSTQAAAFSIVAPTVDTSTPITVLPGVQTATFSTPTVTVNFGATITANVQAITFNFLTPRVPLWTLVTRGADSVWAQTNRAANATYGQVSRASNATYAQVNRSSNDTYNQVSRATDDDWDLINREP